LAPDAAGFENAWRQSVVSAVTVRPSKRRTGSVAAAHGSWFVLGFR
jgi:hypothetical protein